MLLALMCVIAVSAFVVVFFIYRYQFGGGYSALASDWSSFGGFFGGVLGPFVSLLALISLLVTMYFQKETVRLQSEQVNLVFSQVESSKVDSQKVAYMSLIETLMVSAAKDYEHFTEVRKELNAQLQSAKSVSEVEQTSRVIQQVIISAGVSSKRRQDLNVLLVRFSVEEFTDYKSLKQYYLLGMRDVFPSGEV